jgi:hypothetical protein
MRFEIFFKNFETTQQERVEKKRVRLQRWICRMNETNLGQILKSIYKNKNNHNRVHTHTHSIEENVYELARQEKKMSICDFLLFFWPKLGYQPL